ncbi:heme ABC exporter ATP-binding protein CcmA [Mesobacillus zeae]|nr:heme ABC exporter ATP-binding protein CcmA [Mesobacillus zeae]
MLELKNLTKILGDKVILRNVSLSLDRGESLAVVGPNGAGKSTFFKCTVGLLRPTSGEVYLDGELISKNSMSVKQKIGFLGHESYLYSTLTPLENLKFYGKLYKIKEADKKSAELLKEVGLHLFRDMPVRSFSRGMVQRLSIARVLLAEPEILMLDEPHTGLDVEAAYLLNRILKEKQRRGTAILMISHDFEQVQELADRVAVLSKGKIADTMAIRQGSNLEALKEWYEKAVKGA